MFVYYPKICLRKLKQTQSHTVTMYIHLVWSIVIDLKCVYCTPCPCHQIADEGLNRPEVLLEDDIPPEPEPEPELGEKKGEGGERDWVWERLMDGGNIPVLLGPGLQSPTV